MLTIAIMQPYFLPYIGYFQLMNAVDTFVIYDNIQYTKEGWINRNRILANGKDEYISVPLKKGPYDLCVKDRFLADTWSNDRKRILNKIAGCYRKAPHFRDVYAVVEQCLIYEEHNLFGFILNSLSVVKDYLNINTPFVISSTIKIDHSLKGEYKVIEICKALGATNYLNPIGGVGLYKREQFEKAGIQLNFIKTGNVQYSQFNNEFVPFLSIIDVMMFNDKENIRDFLTLKFTIE
jgi:hypothetical protein